MSSYVGPTWQQLATKLHLAAREGKGQDSMDRRMRADLPDDFKDIMYNTESWGEFDRMCDELMSHPEMQLHFATHRMDFKYWGFWDEVLTQEPSYLTITAAELADRYVHRMTRGLARGHLPCIPYKEGVFPTLSKPFGVTESGGNSLLSEPPQRRRKLIDDYRKERELQLRGILDGDFRMIDAEFEPDIRKNRAQYDELQRKKLEKKMALLKKHNEYLLAHEEPPSTEDASAGEQH